MQIERIEALRGSLEDFFVQYRDGELETIASFCYDQACEAGWWSDPATGEKIARRWATVCALFHSEISEALEADRKNLNDDKLTHRKGVEVELADLFIRLMDTIAGFGLLYSVTQLVQETLYSTSVAISKMADMPEVLAELHLATSRVYENGRATPVRAVWPITILISMIVCTGKVYKLDLAAAVFEKLEFNRGRADHKVENRVLEGGKSY